MVCRGVVYTLMLFSVFVGGGTLITWLSPLGFTDSAVRSLAFQGATAVLVGVLVWSVHRRRPRQSFEAFLDSLPRVLWIVSAGGYGVILGAVLAWGWQAPIAPPMLGFGAIAAAGGAFFYRRFGKRGTASS